MAQVISVCAVLAFLRDVAASVVSASATAIIALFYGTPIIQIRRVCSDVLRELEHQRHFYMNLPDTPEDKPHRLDADLSLRRLSMELHVVRESVHLWWLFECLRTIPPYSNVKEVETELRRIDFFGPNGAQRERLDEVVEENRQLRLSIREKLGWPTPEDRG